MMTAFSASFQREYNNVENKNLRPLKWFSSKKDLIVLRGGGNVYAVSSYFPTLFFCSVENKLGVPSSTPRPLDKCILRFGRENSRRRSRLSDCSQRFWTCRRSARFPAQEDRIPCRWRGGANYADEQGSGYRWRLLHQKYSRLWYMWCLGEDRYMQWLLTEHEGREWDYFRLHASKHADFIAAWRPHIPPATQMSSIGRGVMRAASQRVSLGVVMRKGSWWKRSSQCESTPKI